MKSIPAAVLRGNVAEYVDRASRGESFLIERYGRPMAAIVPVGLSVSLPNSNQRINEEKRANKSNLPKRS